MRKYFIKEFEILCRRELVKNTWTKLEEHLRINQENKIRRFKYLKKYIQGKK